MTRVGAAALLLTVGLLTGCGSGKVDLNLPPEPAETVFLNPETVGLLVSLTTTGGMCVDGPCGGELLIRNNGTYTLTTNNGHERDGQFTAEELNPLLTSLENVDLREKPRPERSCQAWVDGTDATIVYLDDNGKGVRVSSCDYIFSGSTVVSALTQLNEQALKGTPLNATAPAPLVPVN